MKNINCIKFLLVIITLLFIFPSCKQSYADMIDSFNHKYFMPVPPADDVYSISDEGFNPAAMLEPTYDIPEGLYLSLEAPQDGQSYSWKCLHKDKKEIEISNERFFYYKVPGNVFSTEEKNTLILTVTALDSEGNTVEYIDTASVYISDANEMGDGV